MCGRWWALAKALVIVDRGVVMPGEPPGGTVLVCPTPGCDACQPTMTISASFSGHSADPDDNTVWPMGCTGSGPCILGAGLISSWGDADAGCVGSPDPADCGNGNWVSSVDLSCVVGFGDEFARWVANVNVGVTLCGNIAVSGRRYVLPGEMCPPTGSYPVTSYGGNGTILDGPASISVS